MTKPKNTTDVVRHAELCAAFMRSLVAEGVDTKSALTLTGNYLLAVIMNDGSRPPTPREPWEGGE